MRLVPPGGSGRALRSHLHAIRTHSASGSTALPCTAGPRRCVVSLGRSSGALHRPQPRLGLQAGLPTCVLLPPAGNALQEGAAAGGAEACGRGGGGRCHPAPKHTARGGRGRGGPCSFAAGRRSCSGRRCSECLGCGRHMRPQVLGVPRYRRDVAGRCLVFRLPVFQVFLPIVPLLPPLPPTPSWCAGDAGFKLRGAAYLTDKKKAPAGPPMFELVSCGCSRAP